MGGILCAEATTPHSTYVADSGRMLGRGNWRNNFLPETLRTEGRKEDKGQAETCNSKGDGGAGREEAAHTDGQREEDD